MNRPKTISASGILPITKGTNPGIYIAIEKKDRKISYTDFGGKSEMEDIYPYVTATREFNEETYHLFHLSPGWVLHPHQLITIESPNPEKVYACHVVDCTLLEKFMMIPTFSKNEQLSHVRDKVIKVYSKSRFPVLGYTFIPKDKLYTKDIQDFLSWRLKRIVKTIDW